MTVDTITRITEQRVAEVLIDDEYTVDEIIDEIVEVEYCSQCGHLQNKHEYELAKESVKRKLRVMCDTDAVSKTIDWTYTLTDAGKDEYNIE